MKASFEKKIAGALAKLFIVIILFLFAKKCMFFFTLLTLPDIKLNFDFLWTSKTDKLKNLWGHIDRPESVWQPLPIVTWLKNVFIFRGFCRWYKNRILEVKCCIRTCVSSRVEPEGGLRKSPPSVLLLLTKLVVVTVGWRRRFCNNCLLSTHKNRLFNWLFPPPARPICNSNGFLYTKLIKKQSSK